MSKLGKNTTRVIDHLAHAIVCRDLDKNVRGLSGLYDHMRKAPNTRNWFRLLDSLEKRIPAVREAMAKQMEEMVEQDDHG